MKLREELREYTSQINKEAALTGMPMIRPMFLQWPLDAGCSGADVEDQFMYGSRWLVAPVTAYRTTSRSVYLPALGPAETWVYYYNMSEVGQGGGRVSMPTPIGEFPLFFIRPLPPPPPSVPATTFLSSQRADTVLCLSQQCYNANGPTQDGRYVEVGVEGRGFEAQSSVTINGTLYSTVPLNLFFSQLWSDNFVSTNATPPDASYASGVKLADGYALASPPPGGRLLQTWFKRLNATSQDYATVAEGSVGLAWVISNGYTNVTSQVPVSAWLLPSQ
jgi:hypothetical protein